MTQPHNMNRYLKIDTSDIGLKFEEDGHQSQLPTPLPSAGEGRRGSLPSSEQWSFTSCPSSVSSFDTQGPVTPPGAESSWSGSMHIASSAMSFDGIAWSSQGMDFKSSFDSVPPVAPCTPVSPSEDFGTQATAHWPWSLNSTDPSFHMPHHTMMPAAGDFGNAFESSLSFHPEQSALLPATQKYSNPMDCVNRRLSTNADHVYADFLYAASPDEIKPFQHSIPGHPLQPDLMTTITPADAFLQEDSSPLGLIKDAGPVLSQYGYDFSSRSPSPSPCFVEQIKSDDDMDYVPLKRETSPCAFYETPRGGKGVSKRRKVRATAAKRRNHDMINYKLGDIDVTCTTDLQTNEDGYLVAGTRRTTKKQSCGVLLPDGGICNKAFERVEHLKRHQDTHTGIQDYHCVMCIRKFNRNDNRNAHYVTHLNIGKKGVRRNDSYTPEHLFSEIRKRTDAEHAEKAVKSVIAELTKPKYDVSPEMIAHMRRV